MSKLKGENFVSMSIRVRESLFELVRIASFEQRRSKREIIEEAIVKLLRKEGCDEIQGG